MLRIHAIVVSVALASLLCSCAGSDKSIVAIEPGVMEDVYAEFPGRDNAEAVADTAKTAATTTPEFGSVVQSAASNIAPVSEVTVAFQGGPITGPSRFRGVVTVVRSDASELVIDTEDIIGIGLITSKPGLPIEGYDTYVYSTADDGITLARVVTVWNADNIEEWMAGGYWLHAGIDPETATWSGSELGAFFDGPYLSGTDSLPESGSATYQGRNGGYYTAVIGSDGNFEAGTIASGEYSGSLSLMANFAPEHMNISGRVDNIYVDGYAFTPSGLEVEFGNVPVNGQIFLDAADLSPTGGATGRARVSGDNVASSDGAWGVQLSSLPDDVGNPRSAAGTSGATYTTYGGSEITFVGALYGLASEPPAGIPQ